MLRMNGLRGPIAASAMLGLAAVPASAGDGYGDDKRNAAPSWRGFYVGAAAGYGIGTSEVSAPGERPSFFSLRGEQGVITAGYDFQLSSRWVAGLFADYAFGEADNAPLRFRVTLDNQWAIGGRLGVLAAPSTLLYASGGYTAADFNVSNGPLVVADSALGGFFVGLGVEQALTRNLSLKLDYRFSDYRDVKGRDDDDVFTFDNTLHTVRLGVNWKPAGAQVNVNDGNDAQYPAPTWSGFYVGAAAGYGIGTADRTALTGIRVPASFRGEQGILAVGYDFRLSPRWVAGLFADYAFGEVDGGPQVVRVTIDNQWSIGGRVGVLATPSTLLHASAGYTAADFKASLAGINPLADTTLDGFFLGLGVEQALSRNLSLKLDYRFSDYEEANGILLGVNAFTFDNTLHTVRLGVNWKLH